ncbi:DUF2500 domain-containing protein [Paenibacillus apii]|uniref:DUF2500 domain-containing protein n=1 Tax=Paenibacillus apii TaxID=1850370 RepID=UPI0038B27FE8
MSLGPDPSWMFDFAGTVLPIFFVVMIGIVALSAGRGLLAWSRNNRMPVLTVPARIVSRRSEIRQNSTEEGSAARTTMIYYLTFEFENGERAEFKVSGSEYGISAERDQGWLTYQGTRYRGFKREPHFSVAGQR